MKTVKERIMKRVSKNEITGCWNWTGTKTECGYGQIRVNKITKKAPRVSWEEFVGEIPAGLCVCHRCDNPAYVNPDHLFLGTQKENMRDAVNKGRTRTGENCIFSKLKQKDVDRIRELHLAGVKSAKIAEIYNISYSHIRSIVTGVWWKK